MFENCTLLSLKGDFKISAPIADWEVFRRLHWLKAKWMFYRLILVSWAEKAVNWWPFTYRFEKFVTLHFHGEFFVIVFLMVLSNFVIEKVLLVSKSLAAADVSQQEQRERRGDDVTIMWYQFDWWLTTVVYCKRIVAFVLVVQALEMKL